MGEESGGDRDRGGVKEGKGKEGERKRRDGCGPWFQLLDPPVDATYC